MANKLAQKLEELNVKVHMEKAEGSEDPDLLIVLGGDGTILRAVRKYAHKNLPVLGINMGTVGFLSNIEVDELDHYLERLITGDYVIDQRMMLKIDIYEDDKLIDSVYSLNELVIRAASSRMVTFKLIIDEEKSGVYRGDGLIIASPTGSTAYSLSAGGPICDPQLDAFIITPIAPYLIYKRPIVLSPRRILKLTSFVCDNANICIDGQIKRDLNEHSSIVVKKADFKLNLIDFKGLSFLYNIENRLRRS